MLNFLGIVVIWLLIGAIVMSTIVYFDDSDWNDGGGVRSFVIGWLLWPITLVIILAYVIGNSVIPAWIRLISRKKK